LGGTGLGRLLGSRAALERIGKNSAIVAALSIRQSTHWQAPENSIGSTQFLP
jgi:hypothetical protein